MTSGLEPAERKGIMTDLYDLHTHILPGIDDGAKDLETSIALTERLRSQGVTHIALTPHYYSNRESLENFYEKRRAAYELLLSKKIEGVTFILGSEAYITDYIFNNKSIDGLCYDGTRYLLTEFAYDSDFSDGAGDRLYRLVNQFHVTPVIAHIERYRFLMKNPDTLEELYNAGCRMQINLDSLSSFSLRHKLLKLIEKGLVHIVGTDTHSYQRGCDFQTGFGIIDKKLGSNFCQLIINNSKTLENDKK